jgi:succinoglycan biosynthesis transport protein ExoP
MSPLDSEEHGSAPPLHEPLIYPSLPAPQFQGSFGPGVSGSTAPEVSGSALVNALLRRWFFALTLGLLAAGAATTIAWIAYPPKYIAEAKVQFAPHPPKGMFVSDNHWESHEEFAAYQRTQVIVAKSRTVLNAALNSPKMQDVEELKHQSDSAAWLEKNLVADTTLGPEVMRLSLSGERPTDLAIILNEITRSYLEEVARKEKANRASQLEQLQESVRVGRDTLRRARSELGGLEVAVGALDPDTIKLNYQSALQQLHVTQAAGLNARLDMQDAQNELASARQLEKLPPRVKVTESAVDDYLKLDPRAARFYAELAKIDEQIASIKKTANQDAWPQYLKEPLRERRELESGLAALRQESLPKIEAQLRTKAADDLKDNIVRLQTRVDALQQKTRTLEEEIKRQNLAVDKLARAIRQPDKPTSDLEVMRADVAQKEATLRKASEQLEMMRIEPRIPSRATLLESAEAPTAKNYLPQIRIGGAVGCMAFGLVVFLVTFREFRTRRIYAVDDVAGLGMNLVGTIPTVPATAQRLLAGQTTGPNLHWQNLLAESVDAIRTQLLYSAEAQGLRVVMVTSALGGEGKTSLASHLATSLARSWRKTLLLDGDLRNPGAHHQFDAPLEPGLSEVLRGEAELDHVIRPTAVGRLWLIPAGQCDTHAIQALAQKEVHGIFERLKDQFDFIVVDSSPVLPVADALSLSQNVDGVIFSILRDVSRMPAVHEAHQRLARLGVPILGTVVIGAASDTMSRSYQYPLEQVSK